MASLYGSHVGRDQCSCSYHTACATLRQRCRGIRPIRHQVVLYCAITVYWHLFLDRYLYSLNIYDSNEILKVRCRYIVISQYKNNVRLMGLAYWQLCRRTAHAWRNTYTGAIEVMLCVKPKVLATVAENQTKCLRKQRRGTHPTWWTLPRKWNLHPSPMRCTLFPCLFVRLFVCFRFYILLTSMVISGWIPVFGNVHLWRVCCAAPLGDQDSGTYFSLTGIISNWANQSLAISWQCWAPG